MDQPRRQSTKTKRGEAPSRFHGFNSLALDFTSAVLGFAFPVLAAGGTIGFEVGVHDVGASRFQEVMRRFTSKRPRKFEKSFGSSVPAHFDLQPGPKTTGNGAGPVGETADDADGADAWRITDNGTGPPITVLIAGFADLGERSVPIRVHPRHPRFYLPYPRIRAGAGVLPPALGGG